ncbi:MAG: hypothetical protein H0T73_01200 [Ardenticatenales bacterium]|nr:hypothetical protein [Ardenticatenales bacterium]
MPIIYLPIVRDNHPWASPFGVEVNAGRLAVPSIKERAIQLGASWHRVNGGVSWKAVQPAEGDPYNWTALLRLDRDIQAAQLANMTPIVIVDDYPHWATLNIPYATSCGPLRADYFDEYAAFLTALVERYKQPPYNVHYWELGNEVDIDPSLVAPNSIFGCWGNINDPYYGGEHYGEMLKAVVPAIRQADPDAKILIGGLLLHTHQSTDLTYGTPEHFFEGVLRSGAAPYFDIVAYHGYPSYGNVQVDYDLIHPVWAPLGGIVVGKARFLQDVMDRYGIDKPLFLNESGLLCTPPFVECEPPPHHFFEAQADHIVRSFTRGLGNGVDQVTWYTLNGPGWRSGGLLDDAQEPKLVYTAYQQLIKQTYGAAIPPMYMNHGVDRVEGYRFNRRTFVVDVLWSRDSTSRLVNVPSTQFLAAYTRDGQPITPVTVDCNVQISVGFSPVYVQLRP